MAKFNRTVTGLAWLEITWQELAAYSDNARPICDECFKSLIPHPSVVLLPILNEAYCPECGKQVLQRVKKYPEDRHIEERREKFWLNYFGLEEGVT